MTTESPRPPTLEELLKILRLAKGFTIRKSDLVDNDIQVSFTISSKDCDEHGIYVRTFGSLFLAELVDNLERLSTFDNLAKQFSSPGETGATAADCVAFINNELRHVPPGGLDSTLRRRLYTTVVQKLMELQEWRVFADKARFDSLWKEQAKQKAQREQAEQDRRGRQAEEDARRRWTEAKAEAFRQTFEDAFRESARSNPFEEMFRNYGQQRRSQEQNFRWGPYADNPQGNSPSKRTWYEILNVPVTADRATIKSAWRMLAKRFHPDRCQEVGASAKMAEINAAKDEGLAGCPV